jgi:cyclic pyranopterin phosphate synthase
MRRFSMVDIASKEVIVREATAVGEIKLKPSTITRLKKGTLAKGDAIAAAEVAAVLAAKNTPAILPLCHPIPITSVTTDHHFGRDTLQVESHVRSQAKTGVEMEALMAASTYLLTVWDMTKQYEKDANGQYPTTAITKIMVKEKIKRR